MCAKCNERDKTYGNRRKIKRKLSTTEKEDPKTYKNTLTYAHEKMARNEKINNLFV